jgi:hypothetical protein
MSSVKAQVLLRHLALFHQKKLLDIPRDKIRDKIKNLKKLTSQKKVPKLSIRKEIAHLEDLMNNIFDVEKSLIKQQKKESDVIRRLRKKIGALKEELQVAKSPELKRKVNHLYSMLGECMAYDFVHKDVQEAQKEVISKKVAKKENPHEREARLNLMQQRLTILKNQFATAKEEGKDEKIIKQIQLTIALVEKKLAEYGLQRDRPKHTILMGLPEDERIAIEKELPLPPPIKLKK